MSNDQPKPTTVARPQCTELTSEQLLAKLNVENTELESDNQRLRELLRRWLVEFVSESTLIDDLELFEDTRKAMN